MVIAKFWRSNFSTFFNSRWWLKSRLHVPYVQNPSWAEVWISKYVPWLRYLQRIWSKILVRCTPGCVIFFPSMVKANISIFPQMWWIIHEHTLTSLESRKCFVERSVRLTRPRARVRRASFKFAGIVSIVHRLWSVRRTKLSHFHHGVWLWTSHSWWVFFFEGRLRVVWVYAMVKWGNNQYYFEIKMFFVLA